MKAITVDHQEPQPLEQFATCLQHEYWTRQELLAYQEQALRACRDYAYAHSPFYQRFHQGLMDRPLEELPVLTKGLLMEQFDELVTDRAVRLEDVRKYLSRGDASQPFLDRYRVIATSGSTGQPGIFLYSQAEGTIVANSFSRFQHWGGITAESRAAVVASTMPAHMTSQTPIVIDGKPIARLQLGSTEPLSTLVQKLNDWQPDVLLAYASMAGVLANEQLQGRLHITPRALFCSAETLTPETRQRVEETWHTKLMNVYGMTESGVLAAQCPVDQGFHLFEDFSIVEVVDQDNRPVPAGRAGSKILLTVLFRRAQPLIRYEVTDPLTLSTRTRCACGRPFAQLESIKGRAPEMLYFSTLSGQEQGVAPLQFQTVFDTLPVGGWQVVQEADGLHVFLVGASADLRDDYVLGALYQMLSKRGVDVPPLHIQHVPTLTRNVGGKAPMLISHLPRSQS